jgi:hypothetical protein
MSDLTLRDDINIRSDGYFIARTVGTCGCCRAPTRLLAVALPVEHETLAMDADAERDEGARDTWEGARCTAILFYVEYLPAAVQSRLNECSPGYRLAHSAATQGWYWANHCERCDTLLDDHDLFCEPDGAFLPTSPASAAAIQLTWIDEPIEAAAGGYACDPEFFASMGTT